MAIIYFLEIVGMLIFLFGTFGFLVAAIVMRKRKNKKMRYAVIMIPVSFVLGLTLLMIGGYLYGKTDEYKEQKARQELEKQEITQAMNESEVEELESKIDISEKDTSENIFSTEPQTEIEETTTVKQKSSVLEETKKSKEVFALELLENWDNYVGDYVTTSFEVSSATDYSDELKIYSPYYDGIDSNIRASIKNNENIKQGEWITVTGTVGDRPYTGLQEAVVNDKGNKSKELFETSKSEYDEQKRIEAEAYEASFKENAESPTYDDLMRYPDSYKEKQIKVKVKIVRIEPDGWIFDGDIEGIMSGEKVAIYDGREKKEPKLREGDLVTIYGYGKGTTTVKVQDVSGWIPKTVDSYDIPSIDIRYIEFDK